MQGAHPRQDQDEEDLLGRVRARGEGVRGEDGQAGGPPETLVPLELGGDGTAEKPSLDRPHRHGRPYVSGLSSMAAAIDDGPSLENTGRGAVSEGGWRRIGLVGSGAPSRRRVRTQPVMGLPAAPTRLAVG